MKPRSSKTLTKFIAIIAFAGLSACATDAAVDDTSDTESSVDATSEDTRTPEDTQSPQDTDQTEDTSTPDEDALDTPDAADPDTTDDVETPDAQRDTDEDVEAPAASGQTCDTAVDATAGGLWDDRSTLDAGDNYHAPFSGDGCPAGQYTEGDEVFVLSPQTDTNYTVRVTPLDPLYQPVVYIRDDCSVDTCLHGSLYANSSGTIELLDVEVPGGEDYFIIVDTVMNEGPYKIEITIN